MNIMVTGSISNLAEAVFIPSMEIMSGFYRNEVNNVARRRLLDVIICWREAAKSSISLSRSVFKACHVLRWTW